MSKITPCLWYDGAAEEAARFYVSLLPGSTVDRVVRSPVDTPSGPEGSVLTVEFTLAGTKFVALNGGPAFAFTEAVSFQIETEDQPETDRLWEALIADGGSESQCGWLKDRWGMSWQITPRQLTALFLGADKAAAQRAGQAMFSMRKIDIATIEAAARGEAADA